MEQSEQVKPQKSSLLNKIHKSLSKKRESGSVSSTDSGVELEYSESQQVWLQWPEWPEQQKRVEQRKNSPVAVIKHEQQLPAPKVERKTVHFAKKSYDKRKPYPVAKAQPQPDELLPTFITFDDRWLIEGGVEPHEFDVDISEIEEELMRLLNTKRTSIPQITEL